ncbi:unnamed protein product [Albugo candida]|uniref:Uncharacterized protein n=1 Tax=Albugo candida TaxID=65357 RepID=A0A024GNV3_9STRA|nr:unnamed protein product [Albugo candida]|eukprot:CCI48446.1 unnamed protein product [Albugo candida]
MGLNRPVLRSQIAFKHDFHLYQYSRKALRWSRVAASAASNLERIAITDRLFPETFNERIKTAQAISGYIDFVILFLFCQIEHGSSVSLMRVLIQEQTRHLHPL